MSVQKIMTLTIGCVGPSMNTLKCQRVVDNSLFVHDEQATVADKGMTKQKGALR